MVKMPFMVVLEKISSKSIKMAFLMSCPKYLPAGVVACEGDGLGGGSTRREGPKLSFNTSHMNSLSDSSWSSSEISLVSVSALMRLLASRA